MRKYLKYTERFVFVFEQKKMIFFHGPLIFSRYTCSLHCRQQNYLLRKEKQFFIVIIRPKTIKNLSIKIKTPADILYVSNAINKQKSDESDVEKRKL